jgi:hypothetical protein
LDERLFFIELFLFPEVLAVAARLLTGLFRVVVLALRTVHPLGVAANADTFLAHTAILACNFTLAQ